MRQAAQFTPSMGWAFALLIIGASVALLHAEPPSEESSVGSKPPPEDPSPAYQPPPPPPASKAPPKPKSKPPPGPPGPYPVKNKTAGGHYYGKDNDDYDGGYGHKDYGHHRHSGYGGGYGRRSYGYQHHLVDDFICDLDASILVVTNSYKKHGYGKDKSYGKDNYDKKDSYDDKKDYGGDGYGKSGDDYDKKDGYGGYGGHDDYGHGGGYGSNDGYGKNNYDYNHHAVAHRLRCSKIAIRNDSDCTTCCQLAARRDRSVSKNSILGFIIDYDQVNYIEDSYRKKRSTGASPPSISPHATSSGHGTDYKDNGGHSEGYVHKVVESYDDKGHHDYGSKGGYGGGYETNRPPTLPFPPYNPRCVCCAPKRRHHHHRHGYGYKRKDYGYKRNDYGYDNDYSSNSYNKHDNYEQEGYGGDDSSYGHKEGYGHQEDYGGNDHYHDHGYGSKKSYGDDYSHDHYGSGGGGYGYRK